MITSHSSNNQGKELILYTDSFYDSLDVSSSSSAKEIAPFISGLINPKSVVDVGCGLGAWLSAFKENGAESILGIDGSYVNRSMLKIPQESFIAHDLTKPLHIKQKFDLAISLEVAEHLPPESAEHFVDTLTSLSLVVLFSAAIPHQPGQSHINCQWSTYWAELFQQRGYVLIDCIRPRFWNNRNVEWWYSQNTFLFVEEECLEKYSSLKEYALTPQLPLLLVHPDLYLMELNAYENLREYWNPQKITLRRALSLLKLVLFRNLKALFKKDA